VFDFSLCKDRIYSNSNVLFIYISVLWSPESELQMFFRNKNTCGRGLIVPVGNWLDGCGLLLADLMGVTGYSPALVTREEMLRERNLFWFKIINTIKMSIDKSFRINTVIFHKKHIFYLFQGYFNSGTRGKSPISVCNLL